MTLTDPVVSHLADLRAGLREGTVQAHRWQEALVGFVSERREELFEGWEAERPVRRLAELVDRLRANYPGLLASDDELAAELRLPPERRAGGEKDQAAVVGVFLDHPEIGLALLRRMRLPQPQSAVLTERFLSAGNLDLGCVRVERKDVVSTIELTGTRNLNAEDLEQLQALELAADVVLQDPGTAVVVLRGAVMEHAKYAGRRVFCAGINLKKLGSGRIPLVGYLIEREAGYLPKILHGHPGPEVYRGGGKPWLAAVDAFAIGGGAQVLLTCDRVVAEEGAYASLPAAQEGIVPGVSNLRLPQAGGVRLARRMILNGERIGTDHPEASVFFDVVAPTAEMDHLVQVEASMLSDPSVAANRALLNRHLEPDEVLRTYLSHFAFVQSERAGSEDVLSKSRAFAQRGSGAT